MKKEEIIKLKKQRKSVKAIAEMTGATQAYINDVCREAGLLSSNKRGRKKGQYKTESFTHQLRISSKGTVLWTEIADHQCGSRAIQCDRKIQTQRFIAIHPQTLETTFLTRVVMVDDPKA